MDKRTKTLAIVFGAMLGVVVFARAIWPRWVKPMLDTDARLTELTEEYDALAAFERNYQDAVMTYKALAGRVGSMKAGDVKDDLQERLNALLQKHKLAQGRISARNISTDRKTGWKTLAFNISGEGPLLSALKFMRDVYELPHVLRVIDPKLVPQSGSRTSKKVDKVKLSLAVQALVLPSPPILRQGLVSADLEQPENYIRHRGVDLQFVSARKPFLEYVKPTQPRPKPTPKPPVKKAARPQVKPPPPPKEYRWKGRWRLVACWKDYSTSEVYWAKVEDQGSRSSDKERDVAAGGDFDGGELLVVREVGALVRREDGDFIYPLGESFTHALHLSQAEDYPELRLEADLLQQNLTPTPANPSEEAEAPAKPARGKNKKEKSVDGTTGPTTGVAAGEASGGTKTTGIGDASDMASLFGPELQDFVAMQAGESEAAAAGDKPSKQGGSKKKSAGGRKKSPPTKTGAAKPKGKDKKSNQSPGDDSSGKPEADGTAAAGEGASASTTRGASGTDAVVPESTDNEDGIGSPVETNRRTGG